MRCLLLKRAGALGETCCWPPPTEVIFERRAATQHVEDLCNTNEAKPLESSASSKNTTIVFPSSWVRYALEFHQEGNSIRRTCSPEQMGYGRHRRQKHAPHLRWFLSQRQPVNALTPTSHFLNTDLSLTLPLHFQCKSSSHKHGFSALSRRSS